MTVEPERPAYLLHARAYRESSLLVELLIWGAGRVGCVARGARGARATAKRAILQPLQPLQVRLGGRGELAHLASAEAAGAPLRLVGDALLASFYLNELCLRLLPRGESVDPVFLSYAHALGELERGAPVAPVLRQFEFKLLSHDGSMPAVEVDVAGDPIRPDGWYRFDPERGAQCCEQPDADAVRGAALLSLTGAPAHSEDARALRRLMRTLIEQHLGGRPLKSWGVLAELRQHVEAER